jgi:hypothetical protein
MIRPHSIQARAAWIAAVLLAATLSAEAASPVLFNTGVDDAGVRLNLGETDAHYTVTGGSFADAPTFAVDDASGYPGYWMAPNSLSRWIVPVLDGQTGGDVAAGSFTYTTTVDLTGLDPAQGSLTGAVTADNAVLAILLNGEDTGFAGSTGYSTLAPFAVAAGFIGGVNTLAFVVHNGSGPSGLRVQMSGDFVPLPAVPEPTTAGLLLAGLGALVVRTRRRR